MPTATAAFSQPGHHARTTLVCAALCVVSMGCVETTPSPTPPPDVAKVDVKHPLETAFRRFVAQPSAERAQQAGRTDVQAITDFDTWDADTFQHVAAHADKLRQSKMFFRALDRNSASYAAVLARVRAAGLPEVVSAIPYVESRFKSDIQSRVCAKGPWQFMPETAHRVDIQSGLDFVVEGCSLQSSTDVATLWTPTDLSPPAALHQDAPYIGGDADGPITCLIDPVAGCLRDDRTDLDRSTAAAIWMLKEAWHDDTLGASGAATQLTILSHNAGYDDARFGKTNPINVLPAYKSWSEGKPVTTHHTFYSHNLPCEPGANCSSSLTPESQGYGVQVMAVHIVAACFYGKNYRQEFEAFRQWDDLLADDGYCATLHIPDREPAPK